MEVEEKEGAKGGAKGAVVKGMVKAADMAAVTSAVWMVETEMEYPGKHSHLVLPCIQSHTNIQVAWYSLHNHL